MRFNNYFESVGFEVIILSLNVWSLFKHYPFKNSRQTERKKAERFKGAMRPFHIHLKSTGSWCKRKSLQTKSRRERMKLEKNASHATHGMRMRASVCEGWC